jgi:antitoxin (DNA-binding transcriptional repressor) of toxin-antitoxin stability system
VANNVAVVDDEVLLELAKGRTVDVTQDGEVVAVLVSPIVAGRPAVHRSKASGGFSSLSRTKVSAATQVVLDDLRADR